MDFVVKYGWYALLIGVVGEMLVPILLAFFYNGYSPATMAISVLGNEHSPVRLPFDLWMLIAGVLFLSSTPSIYHAYNQVSNPLSIISVVFIAVEACILTCFFSVNETKKIATTASKIHGIGSAIGFMLLLFVPLFLAILSFKALDRLAGIIAIISFILGLVFFILFIMADKLQFQGTVVAKEGLWQRMNLFFMYLPLGYIAVRNIFG